jgi:hypothetical protein
MADLDITLKRHNGGTSGTLTDFDNLRPTTTWTQVESKPTTFTPSSHTHATGDITSGTLGIARGGTGSTSYANGGGVIYYNSQSTILSVGSAASQNAVLQATGYNGTHYFGNWVTLSTLTSTLEAETTIATLAANTLSTASYTTTGYRFAHIWLSETAARTTTTIWDGRIDLSDTNQRGTTTGNQRFFRIVWNNGTSTFADNLEIYSASSTAIQFRHSAGVTLRYRIVWEV